MNDSRKGMEKAGVAIPRVLEQGKLLAPYKLYKVKLNWKDIMGPQIAKYSYVRNIQGTTLVVAVLNPVWMNHLFMYKERIIQAVNDYCQENLVQDIRFMRSGKIPKRVVYETTDGEEVLPFPKQNLKTIVLPSQVVAKIHEDCAHLPDSLRPKVEQLRFSQERRKMAYASEKFIPCPRCGRWMTQDEKICFICSLKERSDRKQKIYDILIVSPGLTYEEITAQYPCSEDLYNEVRRDCIYRIISKIRANCESPDEAKTLAQLVTRRPLDDIQEGFIHNLAEKYRRK
jgi:hypothetical protein